MQNSSRHVNEFKLFTGNSNMELATEIAKLMGQDLGDAVISTFSDGEISVSINETVRGREIFVIQSTCDPVNNNLMELLITLDALKRASAGRINVVIPYYGYARQDRKAKARDPITAKLVADLLTKYFMNLNLEDAVVVSPDLGSVTRARAMAEPMDVPIAIVDKRRPRPNVSEIMNIIGDIEDKNVILLDDMIDTAGTLTKANRATICAGGQTIANGTLTISNGILYAAQGGTVILVR